MSQVREGNTGSRTLLNIILLSLDLLLLYFEATVCKMESGLCKYEWFVKLHSQSANHIYYAPQSSPEGARRCPDRGNAGGVLVFWSKFCTVL